MERYVNLKKESKVKGFYYVPGFSKYAISKKDQCINTRTGETVKWVNHGGYLKISATNDKGIDGLFSLHRSKMLLFGKPPVGYKRLQVNHKDGNRYNNAISNLEWCTAKENKQHSIVYKDELYSIGSESKCLKTGLLVTADNPYELARKLKMHPTSVLKYLTRNEFVTCANGRLYRYKKDKDKRPWEAGVDRGTLPNASKSVTVMNVQTGIKTMYDSIGACAKAHMLESKQVHVLCKKNNDCPTANHIFRFANKYNVRHVSWPAFDKLEKEALKDASRVHSLYRIKMNNKEVVLIKTSEVMEFLDIKIDKLYSYLKGKEKPKNFSISVRKLC